MKKLVSMLLVVLLLTAACSNKTAATSTTSGTSATDVAEADATNTGATDNADTDDSAESDAATEASTEDDAETPEWNPSHNPDDYWVGSDEFKLKSYYWSFLPATEEVGFGWTDSTHTKKGYIFAKINGWKLILSLGGVIQAQTEGVAKNASALIGAKTQGDLVLVDDDFSVNRSTLEAYLLVLQNVADNPDGCPFANTGIDHQHLRGISNCPDGY